MRLDFETMDETVIRGFYGGQRDTLARMYADEYNRIMRGGLAPGVSICLPTRNAVYYCRAGKKRGCRRERAVIVPRGTPAVWETPGMRIWVFFAVAPCQ